MVTKLPQAFMQIGWMEDDFRKLTAKVWTDLDNPIKRYDFFFEGFINFVYVALSGGTLLISEMSQQYNCLMELYTISFSSKFNFSWKCIFPVLSYLGMLGLRWMCMHLWINLIKRTINIQEKLKIVENLFTKSMESCPLVISHILAEFHPERATYTTLHNHFS